MNAGTYLNSLDEKIINIQQHLNNNAAAAVNVVDEDCASVLSESISINKIKEEQRMNSEEIKT